MYRFLLSRQWVILTLLGLVLIPAMIKLGFWQLHRHEDKVAHNELISSSLASPAVPFSKLTGVGRGPAEDDQFRTVTATGTYDTRHEVVVRHRTAADEQTIGYFIVTPLVQKDGRAVLVNRGWIEADRDLTSFPKVPDAPKGEVTVTGRIMADETSEASGIKDTKGLPPRQVMLINSKQQAKSLGKPVLGGYLQLTKTSPASALPKGKQPEQIPEPDHSGIGPHMAYAVQWWLFAAAVPVGWVVLVRRERRDRLAAKTSPEDSGSDGGSGPPDEAPADAEAEAPAAAASDDDNASGTHDAPLARGGR
ncbi:SURF1 family cytochrome oxidase biogenesis protein [Streptomyces daliensis]|uniref:SURF1-like protein n=1 Tax=Streptomyces daliensis TaxID=299421 RepID=A0A8T4IUP8_9ACTN|nr:SURF1 family protein [Streptomyces daliensis]